MAICARAVSRCNRSHLLDELSQQHALFAKASAEPANNWSYRARLHVLAVLQQWLELSPETLRDEKFWHLVRKAGRAWQKEWYGQARVW